MYSPWRPFSTNDLRRFAVHPNVSDFEQSDPSSAPTSGLPSSRRQHPTSFEQQKIYREPYGPSRQFVPHNRSHPKEGIQAMNDQGHEGYAAGNDQGARDYEAGDVDFESGTQPDSHFLPCIWLIMRIGIFAQDRSAKPAGDSRAPLNPRKRFSQEPLTAYAKRGPARPQAGEESDDEYFNNPGKNLRQSRYSGGQNNWGVNRKPGLVPEDEVTDAALLKRGLKRGDGADVCKRGYGANDPENIAIVNMYEIDRMSFDQISKKLNANRVENGRDPSLSANGVQNRYNRNAPILFQAEGREFVPLSQRKKGQRMDDITPSAGPNSRTPWTDELDVALVKAVKEWESGKWENVAAIFREKTGVDMDAKACALRHHII